MTSSNDGILTPHIEIEPTQALIDEKVCIRLVGFKPNQLITVKTRLQWGAILRSHATFKADEEGLVDLSSCAPVSGTYNNVDPMGLFWSLNVDPNDEHKESSFKKEMVFTAELEGRSVATSSLERLFLTSDTTKKPVRDGSLVDKFHS